MASAHYNNALEMFTKKQIDMVNDAILCRLMRTSAYTFSQAHTQSSDLPAAIVTDVTLGTKVLTGGTFDAADAVFTAVPSGAAIDCLALFDNTTATKYLICYIDGFSVTPNGGDITIQWQNTTPWIFKI
jgi:hypothetical protein